MDEIELCIDCDVDLDYCTCDDYCFECGDILDDCWCEDDLDENETQIALF